MDFTFTEEQQALGALAGQILSDLSTHDRLNELEAGEWFDSRAWGELAKANLLGIALPEDVGGSGYGLIELCQVLEQVGRAVSPVPALPTLTTALAVAEFATPEQRKALLPGVVAGETILTFAAAEPVNDDPTRPGATAEPDGDGWRLEGVKTCVPVGHLAERVLLPARTGGDGIGAFLVDPHADGVTLTRQVTTNHEPQARLELRGVRVGPRDVLGDPHGGGAVVRWLLDRAIVAQCAVQLGVTARALEMTAEYTKTRVQFDRPIATFQAVGQRAADAYIDVEGIRLTMWQAAWRLSEGLPATLEVATAKYWAADAGQRVVHAAQHLHGGIGVDVDYPLHRYFLWAKQIELTLGGATQQLLRLGAALAAEPV